ncbi:stage II sporulation protein R [Peribacillus saganii]|uniref:Stage II sporulation protein R n=1 Tax=Peribacillus saganii TaxID=2303992 RepID=A0A372LRL7_9BACI|nr:stage II sporulation protein R [Peribacillus saganii]RFU70838.1 stage II sporulation protein R [Peribacillus saganii]
MNKKYIALAYLLILTIGTILSLYMPKQETASAEETLVIPKEAIRLRILANSDKQKDQDIKRLIRDEVNADIAGWVKDLTSLEDARNVIKSHLPDIQKTAERVVQENGVSQTVKVDFGRENFPTKLYGQYLYPAGEYEAIIITLGAGEGANWWCVLFPPLCFLDFSNGTAVSQSPIEDETQTAVEQEETQPGEEDVTETIRNKARGQETVKITEVMEEQSKELVYVEQNKQSSEEPVFVEQEKQSSEEPVHVEQDEQSSEEPVYVEEDDQASKGPVYSKQIEQPSKEPIYAEQDEQPIKAKFLIFELFEGIF